MRNLQVKKDILIWVKFCTFSGYRLDSAGLTTLLNFGIWSDNLDNHFDRLIFYRVSDLLDQVLNPFVCSATLPVEHQVSRLPE